MQIFWCSKYFFFKPFFLNMVSSNTISNSQDLVYVKFEALSKHLYIFYSMLIKCNVIQRIYIYISNELINYNKKHYNIAFQRLNLRENRKKIILLSITRTTVLFKRMKRNRNSQFMDKYTRHESRYVN